MIWNSRTRRIFLQKWPVYGFQWHYFTTNSTNCTNELDRDFDSRCGGVRGKRIGYWSDFSDNRGGWKTWSIAIEGHAPWRTSHYEMSLTFCNWLKHLARGERLVVLDELQYVEWHIVVASQRHIRKRVVDYDRHDVNVFFEDRWRVHLKRRPSRQVR